MIFQPLLLIRIHLTFTYPNQIMGKRKERQTATKVFEDESSSENSVRLSIVSKLARIDGHN